MIFFKIFVSQNDCPVNQSLTKLEYISIHAQAKLTKTKSNKKLKAAKATNFNLLQNLGLLVKSSGLFVWFIVLVLALLEIKRYYNIDVIPGYDSSVDDVYGFVRGSISEFVKSFK